MTYLAKAGPVCPNVATTPPERCSRCGEFLTAEGECLKCEAAKAARIAPNAQEARRRPVLTRGRVW